MYEELIKALRDRADTLYNASRLYDSDAEDAAILYKAADAIDDLSREIDIDNAAITAMDAAMPRWIPVTERLPDDRRDVQITVFWHDTWRTMYGYYDGAYWHLYAPMHTEVADVYVIGWMEKPAPMPLPQLPKEET